MTSERPRPIRFDAGLLLTTLGAVALIGWLDQATGPQVAVSVFYLVPVVAAGWWLRAGAVAAVAVAASAAWLVADAALRAPSSPAVSVWNGLMRLVIFGSIGLLVSRLRGDRERMAALNARLGELMDREAAGERHDSLTGLPNSRAFMEALQVQIDRARRSSRSLTLLCLDLDDLARINDLWGRAAGDELLARVASCLRESIRPGDLVARIGGDEFAVAFDETDGAEHVARRLLERMAELGRPFPGSGFGASIGVTHFVSAPQDVEEALRACVVAVNEAKDKGKNRVVMRSSFAPSVVARRGVDKPKDR